MPVRISDPGRGLTLAVDYQRIYTGAFCAAGLPPVTSVTLEEARDLETLVTLHTPSIHYGAAATLSRPGARWRPPAVMPETVSALEQVTGRTRRDIAVLAGGREIARLPLLLLGAWAWPHEPGARLVAGAYVLPGDRMIARLVTEVFGADPASGVMEGSGRWGGHAAAIAFYRHLADTWRIRYEPPRIDIDAEMTGASHQMIAAPQDVLSHLVHRQGAGNCLDLTLLFAGCFESVGLQPLVFFVGEPGQAPTHAFPGLWTTRARRFQPLLTDRGQLERWLAQGDILALEATGVCPGATALSAEKAVEAARARVAAGEPLHAIDVAAARPPAGQVRPLELSNSPIVQRVVWHGQHLAMESGVRRLETIHVLYGLCSAGGEVTRLVLEGAGVEAKRLMSVIEATRVPQSSEGLPVPTQNYETCWSVARGYARANGHSRLEEIDIWWALVENPGRNLPKVLTAVGGDLVRVAGELERCGGRPGLQSMSIDLPSRAE
jgi:ClpA/ClpB-like protein